MAKLTTKAYTDYPDCVIREVKILSYDNSLYVTVQHLDGRIEGIKKSYLRTDKEYTRHLRRIDLFIHGGGKRHNYRPRFGKTEYRVLDHEQPSSEGREFTSKEKAVAYAFNRAKETGREFIVWASRKRQLSYSSGYSSIECTPSGLAVEFDQSNYKRCRNGLLIGKFLRGYGKMTAKHAGKRPRMS